MAYLTRVSQGAGVVPAMCPACSLPPLRCSSCITPPGQSRRFIGRARFASTLFALINLETAIHLFVMSCVLAWNFDFDPGVPDRHAFGSFRAGTPRLVASVALNGTFGAVVGVLYARYRFLRDVLSRRRPCAGRDGENSISVRWGYRDHGSRRLMRRCRPRKAEGRSPLAACAASGE